jgi:hypothetical protein
MDNIMKYVKLFVNNDTQLAAIKLCIPNNYSDKINAVRLSLVENRNLYLKNQHVV